MAITNKKTLEEYKNNPKKFIETFLGKKLYPYQETLLRLLSEGRQEFYFDWNKRFGKRRESDICTQKSLLLMKKDQVFKIMTPSGSVTFKCIENTIGKDK